MPEQWSPIPDHLETTIQAIASFHARHATSASPFERLADSITLLLGRPASVLVVIAIVAAWFAFAVESGGGTFFNTAPFALLQLALALAAVLSALIILASQARSRALAERRAQLMLQLAFLNDLKDAKIIALIEELRKDDPLIANRHDQQAAAMAKTMDPHVVLDAIHEAQDELVDAAKKEKG